MARKVSHPPCPDFGSYLWDTGSRRRTVTLTGVLWMAMVNYGAMHELSGTYHHEGREFMVTVRTRQTADELAALLEGRHPAVISFTGKVSGRVEVGKSGEAYRVIVGKLVVEDEPHL